MQEENNFFDEESQYYASKYELQELQSPLFSESFLKEEQSEKVKIQEEIALKDHHIHEKQTAIKEKKKKKSEQFSENSCLQQMKITKNFYQIYQLYQYFQEVIFMKSEDPILSMLSSLYGEDDSQNLSNISKNRKKPQSQMKEEQINPQKNIIKVQEVPIFALGNARQKYNIGLQKYRKLTQQKDLQNPKERQGEEELLKEKISNELWNILHEDIKHIGSQDLSLFINLRDNLERVKNKIEKLQLISKSFQKIEKEKGKKSVCKICWQVFNNGKMLGGHVAKKHPGFSKQYKIRRYLHKNKIIQRKRRQYFKNRYYEDKKSDSQSQSQKNVKVEDIKMEEQDNFIE